MKNLITEGIFLYNDGRIYLPKPKELLSKIKKELAYKKVLKKVVKKRND